MKLTGILTAVAAALLIVGCETMDSMMGSASMKGTKFGAPTTDMTSEEYQQLVFLDRRSGSQ